MDESSLRRRARIGSLRWLGLLGIITFGILLIIKIGDLITALGTSAEPRPATVAEVVNGTIGRGQYLSIDAVAVYDAGYEETEDERVVTSYYLLVDDATGHILVVESPTVISDVEVVEAFVSLTGMTREPPTELENLIRSDQDFFREAGYEITPDVYLEEGKSPAGSVETIIIISVLVGGMILSAIPFFFPLTVFAPKPSELMLAEMPPPTKKTDSSIFATGRFLKLKKIKPKIELGKGQRKFTNSVANVIPLDSEKLMVYIHYVVRYNFIPVSKTHWGVFLSPRNVEEVQPGVQYGWTDRAAAQIKYRVRDAEGETLLLTFKNAQDQAFFIKMLKERGYRVGTGIPTGL